MKNEEDAMQQMAAVDSEGTATAVETKPTKKDAYMKNFKGKHPDWEEGDEEGFYGALADDDAARDEEMAGYKSREDEINGALGGSTLNAALFLDAMDGKPIPLSLLQRYPDEIRGWLDDPENTSALEEAFNEHASRIEENKKLEAEAEDNLKETNATIDAMLESGELKSEDEANELLKFLGEIAVGLMMNRVEKDWLIAAKNAMNHDSDVEAAHTQGTIEGRNEKIAAQRRDNKRGMNNHSGLGASNVNGQRLTQKETAAATGAGRQKSMWDGMKTNKLN